MSRAREPRRWERRMADDAAPGASRSAKPVWPPLQLAAAATRLPSRVATLLCTASCFGLTGDRCRSIGYELHETMVHLLINRAVLESVLFSHRVEQEEPWNSRRSFRAQFAVTSSRPCS